MSIPAGTIDLNEKDIFIRNKIFNIAQSELKLRGATQIETPVMELYSTVESLYGGDFTKLVYTLNEGEQKLILRYDMTVPLSRYVGSHGLVKYRRYQYGKVYRRDTPQIQKGRLREFYQFDYDIIGDDQSSGTNDLEMIETLYSIMIKILGNNTFTIRLNHKQVVIEILKSVGIPESLYAQVFSAIDKLDKKSWDEIKMELHEKMLSDDMINSLEKIYILFSKETNFSEKISDVFDMKILPDNIKKYLDILLSFITKMNYSNCIFDPFLIRGMDYYTGLLFEVNYNDKTIMESTIAAGGRYDNMIATFSTKSEQIPAIGMSLGVERIAKILENTKSIDIRKTPDIYVASIGENMIVERVMLCSYLRSLGYYTVMSDLENPKMRSQFNSVFDDYKSIIPVMICIGKTEIESNTLTIKDVNKKISKTLNKIDALKYIDEILSTIIS